MMARSAKEAEGARTDCTCTADAVVVGATDSVTAATAITTATATITATTTTNTTNTNSWTTSTAGNQHTNHVASTTTTNTCNQPADEPNTTTMPHLPTDVWVAILRQTLPLPSSSSSSSSASSASSSSSLASSSSSTATTASSTASTTTNNNNNINGSSDDNNNDDDDDHSLVSTATARSKCSTTYSTLLQWSTIDTSFLHDVCKRITTLPWITSPNQMNCSVAQSRFTGVREIMVDCLFSSYSQQDEQDEQEERDEQEEQDDDGDAIAGRHGNTDLLTTSTGMRVRIVVNFGLDDNNSDTSDDNDDNEDAAHDAMDAAHPAVATVPNADSFAAILPFLCSFPKLERVTLGGHKILQDGTRQFQPLHSVSNRIAMTMLPNNQDDNNNNEQHNDLVMDENEEEKDEDEEEENEISLQQHQSNLITSLCHAYASNALSSTARFVPSLLTRSVCPTKVANGGIVIHGTAKSERCPYCTRICRSFPVSDIKEVLLRSYEDSVFDRPFCLTTRRVLTILMERPDGPDELDGNLFMDAVVKGRYEIVRTLLYMNMLPANLSAAWVKERIVGAGTEDRRDNKLSMPRDLYERLTLKEGIPFRKEHFDLTDGW